MKDQLIKSLGKNKLKENESLADHVHMKVGGPSDFYYEATDSNDLAMAVRAAINAKIPITIIGNGANVLVSDKGVRGLVVQNHSNNMKFLPHGFVEVESGVDNTNLILAAKNRGLTGVERLLKVPGTVGGAIYMNAGDTGKMRFFGDLVVFVEVLDKECNIKKLRRAECEFDYRSSRFQRTGEVILNMKIQLKKATKEELEESARDILLRKSNHPAGATIGSTFKNPQSNYSGDLIEQCGLKGKKIGGAKISDKHANFIINEDSASASDVKALIEIMKKSVKEKFGVTLEEEVRYIGEW